MRLDRRRWRFVPRDLPLVVLERAEVETSVADDDGDELTDEDDEEGEERDVA